jgi:signal transduction histidine kinase
LLHQGVLIVALLAFPDARLHGPARWLLAGSAVPVALLWVPQLGVACLFLAVSAVSSLRLRIDRAAGLLPTLAGAAVGATVTTAWLASRLAPASFQSTGWLVGYELVLICVAAGYAVASREVDAATARSVDDLVGDDSDSGVAGLAAVLAKALGDPDLRILEGDAIAPSEAGEGADGGPPRNTAEGSDRRFEVSDGDHVIAVVLHRSAALEDPRTARAVGQAVRLVMQNALRRRELDQRVAELGAARERVAAAVEAERAVMGDRLRVEVVEPLRALSDALADNAGTAEDPAIQEPVAIAVEEIDRSIGGIESLVAGFPAWRLGGGRLRDALFEMARRRSIPVELRLDPAAGAAPHVEAAILFVASEALANVDKHASASRARLELWVEGDVLHLEVADDGRGGADPAGSGLRGLADRLAPLGGRLQVESRPGAGTIVRAEVPSS